MSKSLQDINTAIKREADELLQNFGLLRILKMFGTPHVTGSYQLDLMTWRDLDLYLEVDTIKHENFFGLGGKLCEALAPVRMQFRNELLATTPGLPHGLYWGIYLGNDRERSWKIDVWVVDKKECDRLLRYCENILHLLDDVSSQIILSIKSQCWQDPEYRKIYTSATIYDAVLHAGVKDLDGFWEYLDSVSR